MTPERFTDLDAIRRLDMRTRVSGLWLTGQDTLCAGQPLAQMSGILTARALRVFAASARCNCGDAAIALAITPPRCGL